MINWLYRVSALSMLCLGLQVQALETQQIDKLTEQRLAAAGIAGETSPALPGPQRRSDGGIPVFGESLFQGAFRDQPFSGFNPSYRITIGDKINLQLWGAYSFSASLPVDPQGNIFIPEVGPVHVAGVENGALNEFVLRHVKRVFKSNVSAYANLEASQPVKVFVTGNVVRPGLYNGYSSDSVLYYLDSAGGIERESGSYIDIRVLRQGEMLQRVDLYQFLVTGKMPALQLRNGDSIVVGARQGHITIEGDVQQSAQIEFLGQSTSLSEMLMVAKPKPRANYARITQIIDDQQQASYLPLDQAVQATLYPGAHIELVSDSDISSISVRVKGEVEGPAAYVLPYGATLADLIDRIRYRDNADPFAIQLYRKSVAEQQKVALNRSLDALEMEALTRQPVTSSDKSSLKDSAAMIQKFISKARKAQPRGQVVLANNDRAGEMLLEDGDELVVPLRASTVSVVGEVVFPTSLVFDEANTLEDYIEMAGGFSNNADTEELVVLHLDGTISRIKERKFNNRLRGTLRAGDEIMIMPKIQAGELQVTKDITEILYRIAVGTAAVLSF
ncbi:polysaccharide biosynthesis/export family protein [Microbulbifer hydrolyticus]|uniref:Polysialic acid transporter n=1 Tax=Microbulbifer hydrolyticus TaxID=48074 RepID=A0A6P1TEK9_9GAMM|nr:SLBB domain-containing protein [Microbulbifer hydrolyticus]MBB5212313.1 protein involved in polysaccharide export with SLBB domain [Microbulbifer hydrolyticus]QHQ39960.1 polysialic acid transporter [Microbulbifer hydrolyticus]